MAKRTTAEKAVAQAEAQVEVINSAEQALAPYLDGKPYNAERLIGEAEIFYRQHSGSAFELGKRLIVLKANCEHGAFINQVLSRVGITRTYAANLMAFARTVVEASALTNGALDVEKLASMDQRKVMLLGEVISDDPEEIEDTGKIGGRTLDEWDAMTRAELKAQVKSLTQKNADGIEQLQATKDKLLKERERVEDLLSATPNAVTESVTRLGASLRSALSSFQATAHCDEDLEADSATILDLVGIRAELRTFYDALNNLIEERFPAVLEAEVPTDLDLTAPAIVDINDED